jgi:hypothetical protein
LVLVVTDSLYCFCVLCGFVGNCGVKRMKIIIAGGRDVTDGEYVIDAMSKLSVTPDEIVSGTARGADRLGEWWASINDVPVKRFPAEWDKYGKSAGYKRNEVMAQYADGLVALWDGKSRGTKHMIDIARREGLQVYVYRVDRKEN